MPRFRLNFSRSEYADVPAFSADARARRVLRCGIGVSSAGLYRSLGIEPARVFECTQVHGQEVVAVDRHSPHDRPPADGMISRDPAAVLAITVGDCLPVLLYDPASGGFGAVHSGWKGTGIALKALRLMEQAWHTRPETTAVVFGPCIQACCYRVDSARAEAFEQEFGGSGGTYPFGPVVRQESEAWYLDLQAANARLLTGAGVPASHIAACRDCTAEDLRLGSFRREGANYTRMTALIGFF